MKACKGVWLHGPAGTATEVVIKHKGRGAGTVRCFWLVCPGQSSSWSEYLLSVVHLRPEKGLPDPVLRFPTATHEVQLQAIDPAAGSKMLRPLTWRFLRPINMVEQVELPTDTQASMLLLEAARAVTMGFLWAEPPLAHQAEPWRTSMIRTSAHLRGEDHSP